MTSLVRFLAATRERLRGVFLHRRADMELAEELRVHIDMEAERLARSGVAADEAQRRAAAAFGGVQRYTEEVRDARGLAWIPGVRLDFALGLRMMKKHPALSIVGGIGMAVGVAVAVGMFAFIRANIYPVVPLDEGDRIVALENRDVELNNEDRRALHDFHLWRRELRTVEGLGAFRTVSRGIRFGDAPAEPQQLAEMTAAGFTVARVAPLIGRYLLPDDERLDAPPVVVIGHDIWRARFGGRADIVGQPLRIADQNHTIVGVMPEDFKFPMYHRIWVPFRANPNAVERRRGPSIFIFGRLAPGVTLEAAQAELAAIGRRTAATFRQNAKIEPMVMPYIHSLTDIQGISDWEVVSMQALMTVLLVVIALNVAMLVYARTATRQGEIAVRTALGASRRRIVGQLFIEALTLCAFSALAGLAIAQVGVRLGNRIMEGEAGGMPFWVTYRLDPWVMLFTVGVAVFAAVIVGVLPALQATGKRLQSDLRALGGSAIRLGRTWTVLIVAQVAIAVAVLPAAAASAWSEIRHALTRFTFDGDQFAVVTIRPDGLDADGRDIVPSPAFGGRITEIVRRIREEPSVAGVTYAAWMPERRRELIEVDGLDAPMGAAGHRVYSTGIAPGYHAVFGLPTLAGRTLSAEDADTLSTAVIVNRAFVDRVLAGTPALGRRIRYAGAAPRGGSDAVPPSRWYRIVGVVENTETNDAEPDLVDPELYYGVDQARLHLSPAIRLELKMRGATAETLTPRLQEITASVDPTLRLGPVQTQADLFQQRQIVARLMGLALGLVLLSVFLLSAAGVYALVSFTITRRRKEIGIRSALGASQRQVLLAVLGPVARQIVVGLMIGIGGAAVLDRLSGGGLFAGRATFLLPVFGVMMTIVALMAAFGPARRGMRTQPTEALRAEA